MAELSSWLVPLPDAEAMRAVDRWAIEERGVRSLDLMERAGAAVAEAVESIAPDGPVAVLCGKGNNGGDGLVAARLLRGAQREVAVLMSVDPAELEGDAAENLRRLKGQGPLRLDGSPWQEGELSSAGEDLIAAASAIVDALLGTGFDGEPHGAVAEAIEMIAGADAPVVSVDVPSGVDASSGVVRGSAVRASTTVTFHCGKPGLWIRPGKAHSGDVRTIDIGVPRGAPIDAEVALVEEAVLALLPRREESSTKFRSGHVLLVGGSLGLSGAPLMASRAAMRAGAGYVTTFVPESLQAVLASAGTPELMVRALPQRDDGLSPTGVSMVLRAAARGGALALGPGIGRSEAAIDFARSLAIESELPLVLDADGLNAHAGMLDTLRAREAATVLTPHAGELARLLALDSETIERERLRWAREAAARSDAIVVLKGDDTLIARSDGLVAVARGGSPALATAGTGDVLTGVIATLLAQELDAFAAACAAVTLHARAGREAARAIGSPDAVIASDVIEALPRCRKPSPEREA